MAGASKGVTRRKFLVGSGTVVVGGLLAVAGCTKEVEVPVTTTKTVTNTATTTVTKEVARTYAASAAYLVHDTSKCGRCLSCMLACSMANEGVASLSLSRIQVVHNIFSAGIYPYDIEQSVCRQCPTPLCVDACPTGACHVDTANGNVRTIDQSKCQGFQACIAACPYLPHRPIWNPQTMKASKCDLCAHAQYFSETGGPSGKQACVEACPAGALSLVTTMPSQIDMAGYDVDLTPPPPAT